MNPDGTELKLDSRRRVHLGKLAAHDRYMATVDDRGRIILTPMTLVPAVLEPASGPGEGE